MPQARFGGGKNAFEYILALLGITQKNGHLGHPQTQGKIERFHQTLKRWLTRTGFKEMAEHWLADSEAVAMSTPGEVPQRDDQSVPRGA